MTRKDEKGGYSQEAGYMAGRDDEYGVTAGSGEKSVAARTDEIEGHEEVIPGPSPHPMPAAATRGDQGHGGDPGFRVRGPVDEARHGEVEDDGEDLGERVPAGGHLNGDADWVDSDVAEDPDAGSGRTEADDGGYLPGEGTGRPL
ncbi:hypothetical protein ACQEUU_00760 [Nonomuraea sp. CA-218870]|uniref:hypothetical protein n=1 Tax=Nonomuraea sp. CA-218870 TaxID=3239998 RepID=UPI003D94DA1D